MPKSQTRQCARSQGVTWALCYPLKWLANIKKRFYFTEIVLPLRFADVIFLEGEKWWPKTCLQFADYPYPSLKKLSLTHSKQICIFLWDILGNDCEQATLVTYFAHMGSQSDLSVQQWSIDLRPVSQSCNKIAEHYDLEWNQHYWFLFGVVKVRLFGLQAEVDVPNQLLLVIKIIPYFLFYN